MKRKTIKYGGITVFLIFLLLIIFHLRYPFWVYKNETWSIGYGISQNPLENVKITQNNIWDIKKVNKSSKEKFRFLADPFLVIDKGVYHIFFELQGNGPAKIGLLQSDDGIKYDFKGIVVEEPFHLSFPQVFSYRDEFFMLPETKNAKNVLLYKATDFPNKWEISDTLIKNVELEDPAILLSDSLNIISGSEVKSLTQYVYTSDSLRGKWKKHSGFKPRRGNETRAGGSFFAINEELYIPFQNSSQGYGTGVSIYKLIKDNHELKFRKKESMVLGPQKNIPHFSNGMHHIDMAALEEGYYTVYDGKRNLDEQKRFSYKASIKYNFWDFYNFIKEFFPG